MRWGGGPRPTTACRSPRPSSSTCTTLPSSAVARCSPRTITSSRPWRNGFRECATSAWRCSRKATPCVSCTESCPEAPTARTASTSPPSRDFRLEPSPAIAAGEVIERPASVVKELIENALDAGARRISIDVRGAGKTSIRVSDDGAGIPAAELAVAFVRHTTSKLSKLADLVAIQSLGFRGEALASIAAVAEVECASGGAVLRIRAGETAEQGSGPLLPGVAIEVRDLFANVPARLKFLKSDATEVAAI